MAKRQRLQSPELEETKTTTDSYLLTTNVDCIYKIFEFLELDELTVVGETCTAFRDMVRDFFVRKYKMDIMKELRIDVTLDGHIYLRPLEDHTFYFAKYVQNITIGRCFQLRPLDVVRFIRKHCNPYLREMSFEHLNFDRLDCALLKDWLESIENVSFFGCQNIHHLLEYCKKIKCLKIDKYSNDMSNQWLIQEYSTLEHLQYEMVLPGFQLLTFLTINPNVKSLLCEFDHFTPDLLDNLSYFNLEDLFVTLDNFGDLRTIRSPLTTICEGNSVKRLQLCFNDMTFSTGYFIELNRFKCLEGLHLLRMDRLTIPQNVSLEHLKILQCSNISHYRSAMVYALIVSVPNLKELYLMDFRSNLKKFIAHFVRFSVKLKKIVVRDFKQPVSQNACYTRFFNNLRKLLPNASKLFIYISKSEFPASFELPSSECPLVQIKKVEFQNNRVDHDKPYLRNFVF